VTVDAALADLEAIRLESLQRELSEGVRDLAAEGGLVEHRGNLAPEERRRDQLTAPAQCESRERRTAAATFGIGSPVSVSPHPAGSGGISVASTVSSLTTI
jgi:hypothetical protein